MVFDFYDILQSIIFFELTILICVLLQKGGKLISNRFLAFFLFAQMMASVNAIWWNHLDYSLVHFPWLCHLAEPFFFTWGPCMLLYITFQNNPVFKLRVSHLLHLVPAVSLAVLLIVVFHRFPVEKKIEIITTGGLHPVFLFANLNKIIIVHVAIYNIVAIIYQEKWLKALSAGSKISREKVKWNRFILMGYFTTCVIYDFVLFTTPRYLSWTILKYLSFLLFAVYFTAILYKAIVSNIFVEGAGEKSKRIRLLPAVELEEIVKKVEIIMLTEKGFLNYDFGLKELAERIAISERLLSQAINECRKQNINDFINSYRIEEAKKIISNNRDPKKTFLEIAYESGFNSKSSFYLVFKKNTGITPSEFKNSIRQN